MPFGHNEKSELSEMARVLMSSLGCGAAATDSMIKLIIKKLKLIIFIIIIVIKKSALCVV